MTNSFISHIKQTQKRVNLIKQLPQYINIYNSLIIKEDKSLHIKKYIPEE